MTTRILSHSPPFIPRPFKIIHMTIPRQVIVVAIATAVSLLGDSTLYVVLPTHADQLGIKLVFVGIILSVNRFVRLITNSVAGYVHDYLGRWWHFVAALFVGACTTATYGLFWGFWAFLIARMVWGTCWSFIRLEGYASVVQYASEQNRGMLMGMYKSISGVGFFAGSLFSGILTDSIGFRNCLLVFATVTFLGTVVTFLELLRNRPPKEETGTKREESRKSAVDSLSSNRQLSGYAFLIWQHWRIYYTSFVNILVSGSITSSTLGLLIKTRFSEGIRFIGITVKAASLTGILLALRWCMSFFFSPIFGHITDRVGRKFVLRLGLIIGVVALSILVTQNRFLWISTAAVLAATARAAVSVSLDTSIADIASVGQRGKTISVYATVTDLGSAIGPLVSYLVSERIGAQLGLERIYLVGIALLISALLTSIGFKSGNQPAR